MDANKEPQIVLVRDSVSGKGLELAESLLKDNIKVMINGEKQIDIVVTMFELAHRYDPSLIYGVPGNIMSVEEYEKFYAHPQITSIVHA
ncbi:MAG: hypothetical protein Q4F97_08500 [Bacteroidales bacterium]|nr:hypothetical protein [Bacteroidales bacterium]